MARCNRELIDKILSANYFLFDLNNTLILMDRIDWQSYAIPIKNMFGIDIKYGDYLKYCGGKRLDIFRDLLKDKKINFTKENLTALKEQALKYKKDALKSNDFKDYVKFVDGALDFLHMLKEKGKHLALVTSTREIFTKLILESLNLQDLFDVIVTGTDVNHGKPNSEPFKLGLKRLGAKDKDSIAFEDSARGIASAKGAGIFTVAIITPGANDKNKNLADCWIEGYKNMVSGQSRIVRG